jgi:hypothetical protein
VRYVAVLACVFGCGRFGFSTIDPVADASIPGDGDDSVGDGSISTGPVGARWMRTFTDRGSAVAGKNGEVVIVSGFVTDFGAEPDVVMHGDGFDSSALVHYGADGSLLGTQLFDATGFCEMKGIALFGDDIYVAGETIGTQSVPAYGACSIATNRQDPIVIRVDPQGQQTLVTHWTASTQNAQTWAMAPLTDGTFALFGAYSGGLKIGGTNLPAAQTDPNSWIARTSTMSLTDSGWSYGLVSPSEIHPGKVAASGDEVCAVGAHHGAVSLFGTPVPYVSGYDTWVARLDAAGNPRFVRGFGSTGNESNFGNETSVVALADGGCLVGIVAGGDVTLDAMTYPVSAGRGMVVRFAGDGSVVWARRMYDDPMLTVIGDRIIGAFANNGDVIVLEVDPTGANDRMLGTVAGTGTQSLRELTAIGPDAVAITVSNTGELTFGTRTTAITARAVAVLGI